MFDIETASVGAPPVRETIDFSPTSFATCSSAFSPVVPSQSILSFEPSGIIATLGMALEALYSALLSA